MSPKPQPSKWQESVIPSNEEIKAQADLDARIYHGKVAPMGGGLHREQPDVETIERMADVDANTYFAREQEETRLPAAVGFGPAPAFPVEEKKKPLVGPPKRLMEPRISAISPEKATEEEGFYWEELGQKPPTERLEYGQLEKIIDVPGQFATHFVDKILVGLPGLANKLIWKEELPIPKTELAEVAAGAGSLAGMIKGPFHMTGKVFKKIFTKPAKTVAGAVIKNIFKQMGTISTASAISEWQGDDAKEVMMNKLEAAKGGAVIGAIFGGAQFAKFAKMSPMLNWILRAGATSAAIDIVHGQNPGDARSTMQKVFDYGLNAWFTRGKATVTPKGLMSAEALEGVSKEITEFNKQMDKEGAPEIKITQKEVVDTFKKALEKPTVAPEPTVEPTTVPEGITISVKPRPDGFYDIKLPKMEKGVVAKARVEKVLPIPKVEPITKEIKVKGRKPTYEESWYALERAKIPMKHRGSWIPYIKKNFKPEEFPDVELDTWIVATKRKSSRVSEEGELLTSKEVRERAVKAAVTPEIAERRGELPLTRKFPMPEEVFEKKELTSIVRDELAKLSERERETAEGLMAERSLRDEADRLNLSHTTISNRRKALITKLGGAQRLRELQDLTEFYAGYPITKEIATAIKTVREKYKEKRRIKLENIKTELQKTPEGRVQWTFIENDMALKEKRSRGFRGAFESSKRALVDTSGNIKKKLLADLGDKGREAVIHHDLIAGAEAKTDMLSRKAEGKIYKGLSGKEERELNWHITSRRFVAVSKYKPKHKFTGGHTGEEYEAFAKTVPEKIKQRADIYFKETDKQLDLLLDEGLISKELYESLKKTGEYSPMNFLKHIDPDRTYNIGGKIITVPDSGLKRLQEGSEGFIETNTRALLNQVIARTQGRVFRNKANKAAYDLAEAVPDNGVFMKAKVARTTKAGKPVYQKAPAGYTKISVMVEGKHKELLMPDKWSKEWVQRDPLISHQLANLAGWLSGTKVLKAMATGYNPEFFITNIPRDIAHIYLTTSEYSSFLPKFVAQFGKDLWETKGDAFKRKGSWIDYLNEGGGMAFLTYQGRISKKPHRLLKPLQDVLGYTGETSEIWTRLALRNRALKQGKAPHEATWIARNYLDFFQGGSVIKALDAVVPYLGAGVQGTRGVFRAIADRPVDTMWKFVQIGTLAAGLYLANKSNNPEALDAMSDEEKSNNFIITTPYSYKDKSGNKRWLYIRIAKDQGQRIVATIFENMMKKFYGEEVSADEMISSIQDMLPIIPTENIPPALDAFLGYALNKDIWRRKDIWKGEKRIAREEYNDYTHPALVKIGEKTTLSPERLEYMLSQFFTRGNVYTSLVSGGLNLAMKETPESDKVKEEVVTNTPFIRRVLRSTYSYSVKERKEIERVKVEETTRRGKQSRELGKLSKEYYKKLRDEGVKDKALVGDVREFINSQPKEDRLRLKSRFNRYGVLYELKNRTWWLDMAELTPEARAQVFWTKYITLPKDEKQELVRTAKKVPGVWSERFFKRLNVLLKKVKQ